MNSATSKSLYGTVQALMALDSELDKKHLATELYINPWGYGFLEFPFPGRLGSIESGVTAREVVQTIFEVTNDYGLTDDWITTLCQLFPPPVFELSQSIGRRLSIDGDAVQIIPAPPADVLLMQLVMASEIEALPDSFFRVARAAGFEDAKSIEAHFSQEHPQPEDVWEMVDAAMRR